MDLRCHAAVRTPRHRVEFLDLEEARHGDLAPFGIRPRRMGRDRGSDSAWQILEQFLGAVAAENCVVQTPVLDALFARAPLRLPAWGGVRDSRETPIAQLAATIVPEGVWHHTSGEPYAPEEYFPVSLAAGSTLTFDLAAAPASWNVVADSPLLNTRWDGTSLVIQAREPTRVNSVDVHS
jgi:endoglucanase